VKVGNLLISNNFIGMASRRRRKNKRLSRKKRRVQRGGIPPAVVFYFSGMGGFGSICNSLLHAYKIAKDSGRPFYLKDADCDGGIINRWHDYFKTLKVYNKDEHGAEMNEYSHNFNGLGRYRYSDMCDIVKEILVFKDEIVEKADKFTGSIGGPYTSLYIRRGDKVRGEFKEMDFIPTQEILKEVGIGNDGRNLFVMTDDYSVVEEIQKELPSCKIHTLTPKETRGITRVDIYNYSSEKKKAEADVLFTSMKVFLNANDGWSDNRSNMGRLLKMANSEKVHLYPKMDYSDNLNADTIIIPVHLPLGMQ